MISMIVVKEVVEIKKKINQKDDPEKDENKTKIVLAMFYSDGLI